MTKEHPVEGDVKREVKRRLERRGWFYFMPNAGAFGRSGTSDILALRQGRFLAIETKLKKAKGSPLQEEFMAKVRAHGGYDLVVNQAMLDDGQFDHMMDQIENA